MRVALLALVLVGLGAGAAHAYPQFQLSTGNDRCSACHVSPAGGGVLNDYGRDEASGTISRGGDGRLVHGAWTPPAWLTLGGDLRLAALGKRVALPPPRPGAIDERGDVVGDTDGVVQGEAAVFPMQLDLYARVAGRGVSLNLAAGLRGATRGGSTELTDYLAAREAYVMYERGAHYVRAGRFMPIYGLRSQDHTAYVRRYLGQHTLAEPLGAAVGTQQATWEAHLSAFVPMPAPLGTARARGVAGYYERRLWDDTAAVGVQARLAQVPGADTTLTLGAIGKRWLPEAELMVLAEVDLGQQRFEGPEPSRLQLAGYLGVSRWLTQGVMLGGALHHWDPDLALRASARQAAELNLQYFPRAHLEVHLLGRAEAVGNDLDHPSLLALLQLHYYL